jgi:CheY-like chemotaxis protein
VISLAAESLREGRWTQPMSGLSALIMRELPALRRYAFCLADTRGAGDALVQRCLERLLAQPHLLDLRRPKLSLFHALLPAAALARAEPAGAAGAKLHDRVLRLPLAERQALCLTATLGFTLAEAAAILDRTEALIGACCARAIAALHAPGPSRVLIIEDEALVALELTQLMAGMGHAVLGPVATRLQACRSAAEGAPSLVLANVRLRGGDDGIEAVREIWRFRPVPVIFVTAYPDRLGALGRDRPPLRVVRKPFQARALVQAVEASIAS